MTQIRVQGEVYESADDLAHTIAKLTADLEDMPEAGPETNRLLNHVGMLTAAYQEATGTEPSTELPAADEHAADEPAASDEPEAHTDGASQEGDEAGDVEIVCPTCGKPWEFPDEPATDPYSVVCPDCHGWGAVATGSKVTGQMVRECPGCQGNGWKPKDSTGHVQSEPLRRAAAAPEADADWDAVLMQWKPKNPAQPWEGARWDGYEGAWR